MTHRLILSESTDDKVRAAILAPLRTYNESKVEAALYRGLAIALQDADGVTLGGLWGGTGFDRLFVQLLVVPDALRGRGFGQRLMAMAEDEARRRGRRGCRGAWLDTFDFQARPFYERLGYTCFGELADYPPGHVRYFMRKDLVEASG